MVPQAQNNDVAGLTNLARNIGGSVGTAFVATMLSRGQQRHESYMIRRLTAGNQAFIDQVQRLKGAFGGTSFSGNPLAGKGAMTAQAFIYNQMHRQSAMLAYLDIISIFAVFCFCMIPVVLAIGKIKAAADAPMH